MLSSLVTCPTLYKGGYMVNVEGVLVDPMSNPLLNHEIRITTRQTVNSAIEEVTSSEFTDGLGNYSFTLGDGWFYLEILLNDTFMSVGDLIVNSGTPTPISLPDLLKYSDPVVVDALTYPPFWQNLIDTLDGSPLTGSRTSREQMVDSLVHVAEIKTTDVSDDGLRRKATYDTDVKTCDSQVTKQSLAYSDDINYLASSSHLHKSKSASHEESLVITDEVNTTKLVTAAGYTEGITEAVIATGSEVQSLKTFDTIIHEEKETILTDSITLLNKLSSTLGVQTHTINLDSTVYVDSNTVTVGTDYLKRYSDLSDKIYESKSGAKVTSDTHSNNGARSTKKIVVDDFIVGREGNDLFEVDNDLNRVTVRGSFRVTDLQDANGNSIEVSDGDTIFIVLQYSDVATGPWHDDVLASDYWRRENLSVNGVVDAGTWGIPYQFRADTAVGNPGDTIYIEYNYSPDGATSWHETLQAGDAYRRERTIINGIPGDWSAIARIIGDNGDEIEIRSQYSVDGINFWHSTFASGDKYERRARFVNGLIDSAWGDPFKITSTSAFKSTVFIRQVLKPSLPVGGTWGSPLPTTVGWEDGIPDGEFQLWATTRVFSEDGGSPQQIAWTPVQSMTDTDLIDFEYSSIDVSPGDPTLNPANWHNDAVGTDFWLAVRKKTNGVFGTWGITRIKGENGSQGIATFKSVVFKRNIGQATTPTGGDWNNPIPTGWSDGIPTGVNQVWMSTRLFSADGTSPQQAAWTTPNAITNTSEVDFEYSSVEVPGNPTDNSANWHTSAVVGDIWLAQRTRLNGVYGSWEIVKTKGESGIDSYAAYKSQVFKRASALPTLPTGGSWAAPVPTNWSDGIPSGDLQLWSTTRIFTEDGNSPQQTVWTTVRAMTDTATTDYEYSSIASPGDPTINPGNWHNDALGDDIWIAIQTRLNGVVGAWQITKVKGETGADGNPAFKSLVFTRNNSTPATPTGGTWASPLPTTAGWSDGIPAGSAKVWSVSRIFTEDASAPQQSVWTTPRAMTDTAGVEFQWSTVELNPGTPSTASDNWSTNASANDWHMAQRLTTNGVVGAWQVSKIRGEDGIDGVDATGIPGLNGSGWYTIVGNAGVWPGDATATAAFISNFGRVPQLDDHLFYVNQTPDPTATDGKRCITPIGGGTPVWNSPLQYIDGDMIVAGTLSADRLVANTITGNEIDAQTTIIAGSGSTTSGMNGYDLATLPDWLGGGTNNYANYRFWAGATDPSLANFSVSDTGILKASNAEISGTITIGNTALTESNTVNSNTVWADVAGTTNAPDNNATSNQSDTTTNNAIQVAAGTSSWSGISSRPSNSRLFTNLLDVESWEVGTSGTQGTFSQNGSTAENKVVMGFGPNGESQPIWESSSDGDNSANGGWNNTIYDIDHTKTYRSLVWMKQESGNGSKYFGCQGVSINNLSGTANSNPYFWSGDLPTSNKWYLLVGVVHGSGYGTSYSGVGGLYDPDTGSKVISFTEYKHKVGATTNVHRAYLYYDVLVDDTLWFARPRYELVDGTEPSILSLMSSGALLNSNTTKTDVGLGNVDNTSDATVLAGDLTGSVSGTAVATIKSGAAAGSTANQSSNATIRAVGAATSGTTGGWTIDTNSIYSGTKDTGGFAPAGSITLYSGGSIHTPWFYSQASGAAFKGDISLATGTLTAASINANNIEGDVTDSIVKTSVTGNTTYSDNVASAALCTVSVSLLPFGRQITFSSITATYTGNTSSSGVFRLSLRKDGSEIATSESVTMGNGATYTFSPLLGSVASSTSGTYTVHVIKTSGTNARVHCYGGRKVLINAFKSGSTLS